MGGTTWLTKMQGSFAQYLSHPSCTKKKTAWLSNPCVWKYFYKQHRGKFTEFSATRWANYYYLDLEPNSTKDGSILGCWYEILVEHLQSATVMSSRIRCWERVLQSHYLPVFQEAFVWPQFRNRSPTLMDLCFDPAGLFSYP